MRMSIQFYPMLCYYLVYTFALRLRWLSPQSIEVNEDDNPDDEDDDDEPDGEVDDLGDDVEEETEDDSGVRTEESSGGTGGVGSSSGGDTMSPNLNECNANLDSTEDSHVN